MVPTPGSEVRQHATTGPALQRYTREFRLVAACLRWPLGDAELHAVAEAWEAVQDWDHLLRVATRHRVLGLLARALHQAGCRLPAPFAASLQSVSLQAARQAMSLSVESLRLNSLLSDVSVDALFLKGSALAKLAYGDVSVRHAKDIDLLVPETSAERAMFALKEGGYVPLFDLDATPANRRHLWFRYAKSMDWVHPALGLQLELHWRLTDLSVLKSAFGLHERQRVALTGGRALNTLEPDLLLAYLCVHGASHGWMRLKWLADVYALLPHGDGEVEPAYERLLKLGAGRSAGQALLLCHDLLQLPLPQHLLKRLEGDATLQILRRSALRLLARGGEVNEVDDLPFGTTSVYLSRLMLGSGPRALASEFSTWGYRPDELLKTRLPRSLLFLFPLVRLGSWLGGRVRHGGRSPHTR